MRAETEAVCHRHPDRGPLTPRVPATPEQEWAGAWFDCAEPGCCSTQLVMSEELRASLAAQRDAARGWTS